jgi:hypothetical protein
MLGHLKAEDFTNLLEGATLTDRRLAHLQSCTRCREKFESVQTVRRQIEDMRMESDDYIPEPDWSEFRSDVRNALLSRSVKREHARREWFGQFSMKHAIAWGFSMVLVFGLAITPMLLDQRSDQSVSPQVVVAEDPVEEESVSTLVRTDVFDDVLRLNADEADSLQMILEDLTEKGVNLK